MTATYFNLVFTRSLDGDHAALQRWYSDHIGILWRCPTLRRATLWKRDGGGEHAADYLCCYAFPDEAGFLAYEHGPAREAARQVILGGWGKDGVAIVERRQFERLWSRSRGTVVAQELHHSLWHLHLGPGDRDEVLRWLEDRVHQLLQGTVQSATLLCAVQATEGRSYEVLVWLDSLQPLPVTQRWWEAADPGWGVAPTVELRWRWSVQRVMDWRR